MYKYEQPSIFSGTRGAALIAVIILHIGHRLGVLYRLGRQARAEDHSAGRDRPDRQAQGRRQAAAAAAETRRDQAVRSAAGIRRHPGSRSSRRTRSPRRRKSRRAAPVAAPPPVQHAHSDRAWIRGIRCTIGEDYYPDASKRAGEEGRCIVTVHGGRGRADHQCGHSAERRDFRASTKPV